MSPPGARSKLGRGKIGRSVAVALALLLGAGLLVEFGLPDPGPAHVRSALRPGKTLQEGVLAIAPEHRRFTFHLRSLPRGEVKTSTLRLKGESVRVTARDRLSRSGEVELNQALAQLSGEIATAPKSVTGWELLLSWDTQPEASVGIELSPEGKIRAPEPPQKPR